MVQVLVEIPFPALELKALDFQVPKLNSRVEPTAKELLKPAVSKLNKQEQAECKL